MRKEKLFTILTSLFVSLLIILTTGCDNKDKNPVSPEDNIVGTWVLTKLILPDFGMEYEPKTLGMNATFKMKSDKTFEVVFTDKQGSDTDLGTWSISNGKITMKSNSGDTQVFDYELSGNNLRITLTMDVSDLGLSNIPGSGAVKVIMEFTKQ